jgi:hypothetical protein
MELCLDGVEVTKREDSRRVLTFISLSSSTRDKASPWLLAMRGKLGEGSAVVGEGSKVRERDDDREGVLSTAEECNDVSGSRVLDTERSRTDEPELACDWKLLERDMDSPFKLNLDVSMRGCIGSVVAFRVREESRILLVVGGV